MTGENAAPAAMPSEREISGIIIDGMDDLRVDIHFDIDNKEQVADWAAAKIAALFAPILAEKEREIERLYYHRQHWRGRADYWEARALAAEAALKLVAEQDVTEIALDPDWPRRICAAAIRAQGE